MVHRIIEYHHRFWGFSSLLSYIEFSKFLGIILSFLNVLYFTIITIRTINKATQTIPIDNG